MFTIIPYSTITNQRYTVPGWKIVIPRASSSALFEPQAKLLEGVYIGKYIRDYCREY